MKITDSSVCDCWLRPPPPERQYMRLVARTEQERLDDVLAMRQVPAALAALEGPLLRVGRTYTWTTRAEL